MGMIPAADDKRIGIPTLIVIISLLAFIAENPFVQSFQLGPVENAITTSTSSSSSSSETSSPSLVISTRGLFEPEGDEVLTLTGIEEAAASNLTAATNATANFTFDRRNYTGELAVYVHRWRPTNKSKAEEQYDRLRLSLDHNGYSIPLVLFSWESDTGFTAAGWDVAISRANANGPILASSLLSFKNACPDDKVRIISHSLGARVVLSVLDRLDNNNSQWNSNNFKIASVHLLGAAVECEEVSKNPADTGDSPFDDRKVYGGPIDRQVNKFYNLYDDEDDVLELGYSDPQFQPAYYLYFEKDYALGDRGAQAGIDRPQNYTDRGVRAQVIARQDADDERGCHLINPFFPAFNCTISTTQKGDTILDIWDLEILTTPTCH